MPRSDKWLKKDLAHVWHPYTQMKDHAASPPLLIKRAKGMKLYDDRGRYYYDTISSWWCNVHGHCHPKIREAIAAQAGKLDHVLFAGFTHTPAIALAEKLISISPKGLTKVFFSDNGSTAVEAALKLSFQYWKNIGTPGKTKFISLDHGYHGDTIGAMSVSGVGLFNSGFKELFFGSLQVPSPYCYRCPMGKERKTCAIECIGPLEDTLRRHSREVAGLILEPLVMAAGGMMIYPKEYLENAARLARQYDVHLIVDEVATGFGRTGKMFACDHARTRPDFLCLSKGITSGTLPLAATLTTDVIYKAFYCDYREKKTFYHGHTYTANPIAVAAAAASLKVFEEEGTLDRIRDLAPLLQEGIDDLKSLRLVGDTRHLGMIGALELVKDRASKRVFSFEERIGAGIYKDALEEHLILRPLGNIIYLFLPLCTTRKELIYILERTRLVVKRAEKRLLG